MLLFQQLYPASVIVFSVFLLFFSPFLLCTCDARFTTHYYEVLFYRSPFNYSTADVMFAGCRVGDVVHSQRWYSLDSGGAGHGRGGQERFPDGKQGVRRSARASGACGHGYGNGG